MSIPPFDIHRMDQGMAEFREAFAPMLFSYYVGLIKAGFSDEQAFILARDFHSRLILCVGKQTKD